MGWVWKGGGPAGQGGAPGQRARKLASPRKFVKIECVLGEQDPDWAAPKKIGH